MTAEELWEKSGIDGEYDAWAFGDDAVCIIQTTNVYTVPFDQVSEEHAYREGEGDRTLDYWRSVHREFFLEELKEIGKTFDEGLEVVCEEFEVL
ncbi:MAG: ASCH domain-containing protein [Lachnospiraceae bacterium]|nr:ASCH domain-containing protein [Lachnospiraceae bacterium]